MSDIFMLVPNKCCPTEEWKAAKNNLQKIKAWQMYTMYIDSSRSSVAMLG